MENESKIKPGDRVDYVPHPCHALQKDSLTGDHPWVLGVRHTRNRLVQGRAEVYEEIEELQDKRVEEYLGYLKRHPSPDEERKNLVLVRPNACWPAVVRAVNGDGTANLDVRSHQGGVTLHYDRVPLDPAGTAAHTFHPASRAEG